MTNTQSASFLNLLQSDEVLHYGKQLPEPTLQ